MSLQLLVSREARGDIAEAMRAFREISPQLASRFGIELERIYGAISDYPQMHPVVYKKFRRALFRRFPYSVFYTVERSMILVVGVVHQSRDESTWKRRA
ncbi:MAG TPA: type II toxin-antitoxin system RelE/ParE family toxin [Thermoanaerobaculia bacterium]|nr:type II toxin-antitoxin system RelE/ParE family toxin [Thermoanaerobaculia bacterium]